jgi:hypothetical protein
MRQSYVALVNDPLLATITTASFSTVTDVSSSTTSPPLVLPGNYLKPGSSIHIVSAGTFSTTLTPTFVFGAYYNAVALNVNVALTAASGAVTLPWRMETWTTIRTSGTAGVSLTQGYLVYGTTLTAVTMIPIPGIALATVAIDTTVAGTIATKCTCSSASASNIVTCFQHLVEVYN